jgi:hypothetical protein
LLLSARKRRPRRNPPRGAQFGAAPASSSEPAQQAQANPDEPCALLQRDPNDPSAGTQSDDDVPVSSR